jgi:hypothetical protein
VSLVNSGFSASGALILGNGVDSGVGVTSGCDSGIGVIISGAGDSIISGSVGGKLEDGATGASGAGTLPARRLKNPPNLGFVG